MGEKIFWKKIVFNFEKAWKKILLEPNEIDDEKGYIKKDEHYH